MSEIKNTAMQSIGSRGIQLQVFDDLWRFAQMAVASGFAPKGFDATAATVAIQMGMELGVTPMQALQGIAVVNGRPCVYGDLGVALVRGSGELENVEERFGGLYRAFQYGAPPHGGMAAGIDRIVMLLCGAKNLREIALFPMNQQAFDLLMGAPAEASPAQLRELGLRVAPVEKKG